MPFISGKFAIHLKLLYSLCKSITLGIDPDLPGAGAFVDFNQKFRFHNIGFYCHCFNDRVIHICSTRADISIYQ